MEYRNNAREYGHGLVKYFQLFYLLLQFCSCIVSFESKLEQVDIVVNVI